MGDLPRVPRSSNTCTATDDYLRYANALKNKVRNIEAILTPRGIHREPPQDMYFKGALFLHTLRSVVDDDRAGGRCSATCISASSTRRS